MVHYTVHKIASRCLKGSLMFKLLRIPKKINLLVAELEMFFTLSRWVHFQTMLVSLLATPFRATVSGRVRILATGTHRTKHNEFLQKYDALLGKVLRFYALKLIAVLQKQNEPLYIIIDDSKAQKRGKHVQAAFRYFDHATQRYMWGHQFLCVCLVYRGMRIPYAIELYRSKDDCKKRGIPFRKITQMAEDLITAIPELDIPTIYVLSDTYYASKEIIRSARAKGFHFVSYLKSNRCFTVNGRKTRMNRYIKRHFTKKHKHSITINGSRYRTHTTLAYLPGVGQVRIVFSQKKGHHKVLPIFSTDPTLTSIEIITIYRIRWSIEVLFKETKQHLGLTAYHHRDEKAARTHLTLVFIAHALLTHLFITEQREKGKLLTKKLLATFSVREQQERIRSMVSRDTLEYVKEQSDHSDDRIFKQIQSYLLAA